MSTQNSQNNKSKEQHNTECLDEMINKLEEIKKNTSERA